MPRRRKQPANDREVIDAEIVDAISIKPPAELTPEEIWLESEHQRCALQARLESIEQMPPEKRFDAIVTLTDHIQLRMQDAILSRLQWLKSDHREIREEALELICRLQDASSNITRTNVALYDALGLGERKGVALGGKDVPKLLLPSMSREELERKYSDTVQQFGPPKGDA